MTKEQFIKQLHEDADRFKTYVDEIDARNPNETHGEQDAPDWFEQFMMFVAD